MGTRKNRLTEALRWFLHVPTIYVLSKNKKNIKKNSSENYHFYSREILQYIARTGLRNAGTCVSSQKLTVTCTKKW